MKKVLIITGVFISIILLSGCMHGNDALKFKEEYESLNGKTNNNNKEYREIEIAINNPFIYTDLKKINKMIEKKKTFIVYFGANWCPWCRSVLPTAIEEAEKAGVNKIYYIDVRPDNDIEKDIRDIYDTNEKGKIYLSHKGTDDYHTFIKYASSVLPEYSSHVVDVSGTKFAGQKRVGAPSFILVKEGIVTKLETGVSDAQNDPYMLINTGLKEDMQSKFKSLYDEFLK